MVSMLMLAFFLAKWNGCLRLVIIRFVLLKHCDFPYTVK